MIIIPAIDLIDGQCVRLTQGDYSQKTIYNNNPVEVAKSFEDAGLNRLHLVDLDGAKAGQVTNWKVLEDIAKATNLVIDFGGGIKQQKDVDIVLASGAKYATIGSIAVKDEPLFSSWIEHYGPDRFLLGADVKDTFITIGGWLETTELSVFDFIDKYIQKGILHIFCTDVSKDGLLQGPSLPLYKKIIQKFSQIEFIASGGVSSLEDLHALKEAGCAGAIVGKAIYEGKITLDELTAFNQ